MLVITSRALHGVFFRPTAHRGSQQDSQVGWLGPISYSPAPGSKMKVRRFWVDGTVPHNFKSAPYVVTLFNNTHTHTHTCTPTHTEAFSVEMVVEIKFTWHLNMAVATRKGLVFFNQFICRTASFSGFPQSLLLPTLKYVRLKKKKRATNTLTSQLFHFPNRVNALNVC